MACHVARISQMHSAAAACSQWREAFIEVVLGDTAASRPERCAPWWPFRTTRDRTLRYLLPECSCSSLHCSRALNLNAYNCMAWPLCSLLLSAAALCACCLGVTITACPSGYRCAPQAAAAVCWASTAESSSSRCNRCYTLCCRV